MVTEVAFLESLSRLQDLWIALKSFWGLRFVEVLAVRDSDADDNDANSSGPGMVTDSGCRIWLGKPDLVVVSGSGKKWWWWWLQVVGRGVKSKTYLFLVQKFKLITQIVTKRGKKRIYPHAQCT